MDYTKIDIVGLRKLYEGNGKTEELSTLIKEVFKVYKDYNKRTFCKFLNGLVIPKSILDNIEDLDLIRLLLENKSEPKDLIITKLLPYLDGNELVSYINNGLIGIKEIKENIISIECIFAIFNNFNLSKIQKKNFLLEIIRRLKNEKHNYDTLIDVLVNSFHCLQKCSEDENLVDLFLNTIRGYRCNYMYSDGSYIPDQILTACSIYIDDELSLKEIPNQNHEEIYYSSILDRILSDYILYKTLQFIIENSYRNAVENTINAIGPFKKWVVEQIKTGKVMDIAYLDNVLYIENYEEILNYFISIGNLDLYEIYRDYFNKKDRYINVDIIRNIDNKYKLVASQLMNSSDNLGQSSSTLSDNEVRKRKK